MSRSVEPGVDGAPLQYLDFDIDIGPRANGCYPVAVVRSPGGEARGEMTFPYAPDALDSVLTEMQIALLRSGGVRRSVPSAEEDAVRTFGAALFEALFTGNIRTVYDVSSQAAAAQGSGLRLKLRMRPPELARLPWEFLYDHRRAEYLALSRDTPIVRFLEMPQPIAPLAVRGPLRILGMTVSPADRVSLDVERERLRVDRAVSGLQEHGLVRMTWLTGGTWRHLQRALRGGPWHVFHFVGHGGFDHVAGEGYIDLCDDAGTAHSLHATDLARLLADHHALRLVVLNSCLGARSSVQDVFSSTAAVLVRRGIPAVLAMQDEITDPAAVELARSFYEALADGEPVDGAVAEARKAVSLAVPNSIEWGTPVLFMRAEDGSIFDVTAVEAIQEQPSTEGARGIEALYTDALTAFWVEDWDTAVARLGEIVRIDPGYADAAERLEMARWQRNCAELLERSTAAEQIGDWRSAEEALERLVAVAPTYGDAADRLATARTRRRIAELHAEARRLGDAGRWNAVVKVADQLLELEPDVPATAVLRSEAQRHLAEERQAAEHRRQRRRAVEAMEAGHWSDARDILATLDGAEAGILGTTELLARCEREIARQNEQRRVDERRHADAARRYRLAVRAIKRGRVDEGLARWRDVRRLDPDFPDREGVEARTREAPVAPSRTQRRHVTIVTAALGVAATVAVMFAIVLRHVGESGVTPMTTAVTVPARVDTFVEDRATPYDDVLWRAEPANADISQLRGELAITERAGGQSWVTLDGYEFDPALSADFEVRLRIAEEQRGGQGQLRLSAREWVMACAIENSDESLLRCFTVDRSTGKRQDVPQDPIQIDEGTSHRVHVYYLIDPSPRFAVFLDGTRQGVMALPRSDGAATLDLVAIDSDTPGPVTAYFDDFRMGSVG